MAENKNRYGLILPKKPGLPTINNEVIKKPSIFNEDSDSESESNVDWVKKSLHKEPYGGGPLTRQSKADIQKVLAEDPTAYQYDEVYDELQKNINDSLAAKKTDRKPKYIQLLLAQAERRKRENERRLARQIQKERETEGDEFADKEVFVTSAYKKKLEEMKKMDEEDKHTGMLEDIGDVMKQKDMTGFYRHIYRLTVAKEDLRDPPPAIKLEPKDDEPTKSTKPNDLSKSNTQPRTFRKRKSSESSESGDEKSAKLLDSTEIKTEPNQDADSDLDSEKNHNEDPSKESQDKVDAENSESNANGKDEKEPNDATKDQENDESKKNITEPTPKRSIWLKRTVDEVLDAALERYFQRKSERLAAKGS